VTRYNVCGICLARKAEPIKLSFGTVSGPRNYVLDGCVHWRHLTNTVEWLCTAAISGSATMAMWPIPKLLWAVLLVVVVEVTASVAQSTTTIIGK